MTYSLINTMSSMAGSQLSYSVTCSGIGIQYAFLLFDDGSLYTCDGTLNFLDIGFNRASQSLTVFLEADTADAYVSWSMSFTVID